MAEADTWEGKKNLGNAKEAIEEFEKGYERCQKTRKRRKNI